MRRTAACPLTDAELLWIALGAFARVLARAGGGEPSVARALLGRRAALRLRGVRREVVDGVGAGRGEDLAGRVVVREG